MQSRVWVANAQLPIKSLLNGNEMLFHCKQSVWLVFGKDNAKLWAALLTATASMSPAMWKELKLKLLIAEISEIVPQPQRGSRTISPVTIYIQTK